MTLIELLVVLSIIGMMAVLAAPMVGRSLPAFGMRSAADDLAASFRSARAHAIHRNLESWVLIDVNERTYRAATGDAPLRLSGDLRMEMVAARSEMIEAGRARIRFYPDGTSTGGRVRLIGEAGAMEIDIDWFDGGVTVVETDAE